LGGNKEIFSQRVKEEKRKDFLNTEKSRENQRYAESFYKDKGELSKNESCKTAQSGSISFYTS